VISSYAEGINVLFRTNTIYMGSISLMRYLPRLLLPQRLANITALELSWDFTRSRVDLRFPREDWPAYDAFAILIASAFPSLKSLYVSIQVCPFFPAQSSRDVNNPLDATIDSYERKILRPIDEMVGILGPSLHECQIAPQYGLYMSLKYRAESTGVVAEKVYQGGLHSERFWRPLPAEYSKQASNSPGYWIREGRHEMKLDSVCF
jgi:hypothetical protein